MSPIVLTLLMSSPAPVKSIDHLVFMSGQWRYEKANGAVFEEQWMKPDSGSMLGMSRTIRNGKVSFVEFLQIDEKEGKIMLTLTHKLGDPAIHFEAMKVEASEVVFKSLDDPNNATVTYRKTPEGLFANVSGDEKGQKYSLDFSFRKVTE